MTEVGSTQKSGQMSKVTVTEAEIQPLLQFEFTYDVA